MGLIGSIGSAGHRLHPIDVLIRFFKRQFFRILQLGLAPHRFDLITVDPDKPNAILPSTRRTLFLSAAIGIKTDETVQGRTAHGLSAHVCRLCLERHNAENF